VDVNVLRYSSPEGEKEGREKKKLKRRDLAGEGTEVPTDSLIIRSLKEGGEGLRGMRTQREITRKNEAGKRRNSFLAIKRKRLG